MPEADPSFWEDLFDQADRTIRNTIAALPPELKSKADQLPFLLELWPDEELADDTLGTFTGFESGRLSDHNGPIVLFIGSIHQYCIENHCDFQEEVRTTYLHEFGHFLGWDEDDLAKRGLL